MSCSNSYDVAYMLCNTLRLYRKRFCKDDMLIIYPSAWYDGFFEIMFRDKDDSSAEVELLTYVLVEIVEHFLPDDWELVDIPGSEVMAPLKLQFKGSGYAVEGSS